MSKVGFFKWKDSDSCDWIVAACIEWLTPKAIEEVFYVAEYVDPKDLNDVLYLAPGSLSWATSRVEDLAFNSKYLWMLEDSLYIKEGVSARAFDTCWTTTAELNDTKDELIKVKMLLCELADRSGIKINETHWYEEVDNG